jgi:hydrophobe/amphiphile efflux-1 (HAE1) family protein
MFSQVFIERPRLAVVVSIIITLAGLIALFNIPVAQYPPITPPVVRVSAVYPGANAQVVADTVASSIEKEVNGVEKMLYMESTCSNDGRYDLSVTFAVGTDPDINQVNLQNRVQLATTKLPQEVIEQGISVRQRSTDILGVITFISPKGTRDRAFLSNYVSRNITDALVRIDGVSDVFIFGEFEYSMRIWLDPDRLTARGLTADDVIAAIRQQNVQAAAGAIGTAPNVSGQQVQYSLQAKGRLDDPGEFENIIVHTGNQGGLVRVRDVARVELGGRTYATDSTINGQPSLGIGVYRSSDANALETMNAIRLRLDELAQRMPEDMIYNVMYDTTRYVSAAIHEIIWTLSLTFLLVLFVNFLFLQDWRATLVPTVTIPVSLIGTFAVLLLWDTAPILFRCLL